MFPYLRPYWGLAVFSVILIVVGALVGLLAPWPIKVLIDTVLGDHRLNPALERLLGPLADSRRTLLVTVVVAGLMITLLQNALTVIENYINTKLHNNIVFDFRGDLLRHTQRLSLTFHDEGRTGMLIYSINFEADAAGGLLMAAPEMAQSVLVLVGMFSISLKIDRELALLSLTVLPFLYYSVGYYTKNIQKRLWDVKAMEGESLSIIHEAMSMLRVIVAFGREDYEVGRFRTQGRRTVDQRVRVTVYQTLFSLAVNMITAIGSALVLGFGAYHVLQGRLTAGELLVVIAYIASVYKPLESLSYTVSSLQDRFVSLQMAFKVLDTEPEVKEMPDAATIGRAHGDVTLEGVNFSYKGRTDTLQDISFHARAGQVVAIVGPTGAGKTTLISLIARFYDPSQGRVLIDGIDVRSLTLSSLREQISMVLQEPLMFSGTVAENIRYGRLDASMDEIIAAAQAANAHDFIMRMPDQYNTHFGERGVQLSGGERQRICVARAFLKDAPILILDEPTSSIDSKTEAVILDALDELMIGRTTFMIAHRLSTVRHADFIIVLDQGRVVDRGTHEQLMRHDGLYKQLQNMQLKRRQRGSRSIVPAGANDTGTAHHARSAGERLASEMPQRNGAEAAIPRHSAPLPHSPASISPHLNGHPMSQGHSADSPSTETHTLGGRASIAEQEPAPPEVRPDGGDVPTLGDIEGVIERIGAQYVADLRTLTDEIGRFYAAQSAAKDEWIEMETGHDSRSP